MTVTTEQLDEWERKISAAGLNGPVEFQNGFNGKPYNFQVPQKIGGMRVHPLVLMKTLKGWEPSREVADLMETAVNAVPQLVAEVRRLRAELQLWKPMSPEEAEAAYAEAEAVPLAPGEVEAMAARIMERINDPAYRPTEPEHVRLVLENRRLRDENRALKLLNAIQKFDGDEADP